jgi:hypothetical protein
MLRHNHVPGLSLTKLTKYNPVLIKGTDGCVSTTVQIPCKFRNLGPVQCTAGMKPVLQ